MPNDEKTGDARDHPPVARRWSAPPVVQLFAEFWRARRNLAVAWWVLLGVAAVLPSLFAVLTGRAIGQVAQQGGAVPVAALLALGTCFLVMQVLPHVETVVSMSLGALVAERLNDRMVRASIGPAGLSHLEDPDLHGVREVDRTVSPPLFLAVHFLRGSMLGSLVGVVSAVVLAWYAWWAAVVLLVVWSSTHWLLRRSAVWQDRAAPEADLARQHADYAYELAMDPRFAKEVRLFGLDGWVVDRFTRWRRALHDAQYLATRLHQRSVAAAAVLVLVGNVVVFGFMGHLAVTGAWPLSHAVAAVQLAAGVQWVAFGGLSWAADDAAAAVVAVNRLVPLLGRSGLSRPAAAGSPSDRPAVEVELRDVRFRYPRTDRDVYSRLSLRIPAGGSLAIVGANGAGKTTLAKLLCRFYDPDSGDVLVDGVDLRTLDVDAWRGRIAAVFQDFARFERSLRDNVDPGGRCTDEEVLASLRDAGADHLADLDTPMAKGYPGGVDLSGGQWQRLALARVLCGVRSGAGLVILDEPTANLDVVGEMTVFSRLLAETRGATTVLISHRFSTVRMVDRIAVLVDGRVAEIGSHDELVAANGHYRRMFDLQAKRFHSEHAEDGRRYDVID